MKLSLVGGRTPLVKHAGLAMVMMVVIGCLSFGVAREASAQFAAAVNYGAGSNPRSVAIADLNGDTFLDLAVANTGSANVSVLLGSGAGTFAAAVNYGAATSPFSVAIADLNGDNFLDLAVANAGSNNVSVLLNATNFPPDCSEAVAVLEGIWPPNHQLTPVSIVGVTDPDGDPVTITVTGVTQDEPLNTVGDGNTCPDAVIGENGAVQVRMERSGTKKVPGNGRVYAISFEANDGQGGTRGDSDGVCAARPAARDRVRGRRADGELARGLS